MSSVQQRHLGNAKAKFQRELHAVQNELDKVCLKEKSLSAKVKGGTAKFKEISLQLGAERKSEKCPIVITGNVAQLDKKLTLQKNEITKLGSELKEVAKVRSGLATQALGLKKRVDFVENKSCELQKLAAKKAQALAEKGAMETLLVSRVVDMSALEKNAENRVSKEQSKEEIVDPGLTRTSSDCSEPNSRAIQVDSPLVAKAEPAKIESENTSPFARMHQLMTEVSERIRRERLDASKLSFSFQSDAGAEVHVDIEKQSNDAIKIVLLPDHQDTCTLLEEDKQRYVELFSKQGIEVAGIEVQLG